MYILMFFSCFFQFFMGSPLHRFSSFACDGCSMRIFNIFTLRLLHSLEIALVNVENITPVSWITSILISWDAVLRLNFPPYVLFGLLPIVVLCEYLIFSLSVFCARFAYTLYAYLIQFQTAIVKCYTVIRSDVMKKNTNFQGSSSVSPCTHKWYKIF